MFWSKKPKRYKVFIFSCLLGFVSVAGLISRYEQERLNSLGDGEKLKIAKDLIERNNFREAIGYLNAVDPGSEIYSEAEELKNYADSLYNIQIRENTERERKRLEEKTENKRLLLAYTYAEDEVKKRLKSPRTAQFPGTSERVTHIKYISGDTYFIDSFVDSQNGFGALVRTHFYCKIEVGEDYYRLLDLKTEL